MDELFELAEKHGQYPVQAYLLIFEGLEWARQNGSTTHLSGPELAQAIFVYSVDTFGPTMAKIVWEELNIKSSEDFGEMVFQLLDSGLMQKEEEDQQEDFDGILTIDFFDKVDVLYEPVTIEVPSKQTKFSVDLSFGGNLDEFKFKPSK